VDTEDAQAVAAATGMRRKLEFVKLQEPKPPEEEEARVKIPTGSPIAEHLCGVSYGHYGHFNCAGVGLGKISANMHG